jgi:Fe-Mn family superoxide dismutase
MTNSKTRSQAGMLYSAITNVFGSTEQFYNEFKNQALSVFGSGYAWLVMDDDGNLRIITLANQDTPVPYNLYPLLAIDVWEHAYYLKHYNEREAYIDDWFNIVNWERAGQLYEQCINAQYLDVN